MNFTIVVMKFARAWLLAPAVALRSVTRPAGPGAAPDLRASDLRRRGSHGAAEGQGWEEDGACSYLAEAAASGLGRREWSESKGMDARRPNASDAEPVYVDRNRGKSRWSRVIWSFRFGLELAKAANLAEFFASSIPELRDGGVQGIASLDDLIVVLLK